jgi:hypothetical protein
MNLGGRDVQSWYAKFFFPPMTLLFETRKPFNTFLWGLLGDSINVVKYFSRRVFEVRVMFSPKFAEKDLIRSIE